MNLKLSESRIFDVLFFFYIVLIMTFSTANLGVKVIRVVLTGFFLACVIRKKLSKFSLLYLVWALTFLVYCGIGISSAYSESAARQGFSTLLYVVIIDLIIYYYLSLYPDKWVLMAKFVIFGALVSNIYVYSRFGLTAFLNARSVSGINANMFGAQSAIAMTLSFMMIKCIIKRQTRVYYFYFACTILCFIFMILSASRKVFFYAFIPIAIYYICRSKNPIKLLGNIILCIVVCLAFYWALIHVPILYNSIGYRIESMLSGLTGGDTDGSIRTRLYLTTMGKKWFREKPLNGYGLANFTALLNYYRPDYPSYYAHNNYIELLVDCGVIGTIIYYFLHVVLLVRGVKCIRSEKYNGTVNFLFGILVAILVCDYAQITYYFPFFQLLLILVYIRIYGQKKLV